MVNRMNYRRRFIIISAVVILVLLVVASVGVFIEYPRTSSIQAFISHGEQVQATHQVGQNLFVNNVPAWEHLSVQQQTILVNALHSEESAFETEYKSKQFTRPLFPQAAQESLNQQALYQQALFNVIKRPGAMAVHDNTFGFGWGMNTPFTTPPPSIAAFDTLTNSFIPCVSEQSDLEVCGGLIAKIHLYTTSDGQHGFSGIVIAAIGYAAAIAQEDLVASLPSSDLPAGGQDTASISMHTFSVNLASNIGLVDAGAAPASLYEEGPWGQMPPQDLAGVNDSLAINLPGIETIEKAISVAQTGYDALESSIQGIQSVAPCTILTGFAFDQAIYSALAKDPISIPSASCIDTPFNWTGTISGDTSLEFDVEPTAAAVDFGAGVEYSALFSFTSAQISVSSPSTTQAPFTTTPEPGSKSSNLLWRYQTGGSVQSSPTVANGVVYISSDDDYVYAINAGSGSVLWRYNINNNQNVSTPAVVNGVVYVNSFDGAIYALKASTGAFLWKYQTGNWVVDRPTVMNGIVYFGSGDDYLYALNASNGTLLWRYQTGYAVVTTPAVVNGVVYFGSWDFYVYALNASNGTLLWRYQTGNYVESPPTVVNGVVYVGSSDSNLYALNASDGALLWHYQTGGPVHSSPVVANGMVYFGSYDSYAYALTANTGSLLWRYQTGGVIALGATVDSGVVYIGSNDGYLYALAANNGSLLWRYQTGANIHSTPVVANGVVYFGSGDDYVYALTTR
jgi:outer membrane protein assembly factor BamB